MDNYKLQQRIFDLQSAVFGILQELKDEGHPILGVCVVGARDADGTPFYHAVVGNEAEYKELSEMVQFALDSSDSR